MGLVFNGNIDPESDTCPKESSSSSTEYYSFAEYHGEVYNINVRVLLSILMFLYLTVV